MKKKSGVFMFLSLCLVIVTGVFGCGGNGDNGSPTAPGTVLVEENVVVGGGGGSVNVSFSSSSGQNIRITLTASNPMEPYGYLTYPDGTGVDTPPNGMAQNGVNSSDITLNQTGTYTLTVFDGANQGGTVNVKVEVL